MLRFRSATGPDVTGQSDTRPALCTILISRTIMVACCNPFDAAGRAAVQQSLDYTVSWYLARPAAIERTLQDVYRLAPKA
ncbi:MAG: hypothetical protein DME86_13310 [Verrucomicrobia bacterium]|nr:MAG: hypothetical protein DME86_13310 [Verrucomicrobiota bacterium]